MGGPCTVENKDMIMESAKQVAHSGVRILRGGAFKPRTDPNSFRGHGEKALKWMSNAAEE